MSETRWREVNTKTAVEVPTVPNFLRVKGAVANDQTIPLSAVNEADLRALGEEWTNALIRRAKEQQEAAREVSSSPSGADTEGGR